MNDYSKIGAVCFDCAKAAGLVQKNKIVGACEKFEDDVFKDNKGRKSINESDND